MQSEYRLAIKIGVVALIFIIRQIYKSANSRTKEVTISATLEVDSELIDKLQMKSGETVLLHNKPDTFEVVASAKGVSDRFQQIGVIEDRELSEKVRTSSAQAVIDYVAGTSVKINLTY